MEDISLVMLEGEEINYAYMIFHENFVLTSSYQICIMYLSSCLFYFNISLRKSLKKEKHMFISTHFITISSNIKEIIEEYM